MQLDVVTLFPEWFGWFREQRHVRNAMERGHELRALNPRDHTELTGRQVDDTPFGGGAGMVMKPGPWAEALRRLGGTVGGEGPSRPRLLVPAPSGRPFTQAFARELATEPWLAFACGRYEGIDERVYAYAADSLGWDVTPVSLGDYVLNGGEVAVLAMVAFLLTGGGAPQPALRQPRRDRCVAPGAAARSHRGAAPGSLACLAGGVGR